MRYAHHCVTRDPDTGEAVFVAKEKGRIGFVFGNGELWPGDNLPDVTFTHTPRQLARKFRVDDPMAYGSIQYISLRLLRNKLIADGKYSDYPSSWAVAI